MRARLAALAPISSADCNAGFSPRPISTIVMTPVPASRREVGERVFAQGVTEARQSVGGALEGARKLDRAQRIGEIELAAQHVRRYRPLGGVGLVLDVDKPAHRRQCVLGIHAVTFRHLGRGIGARCRRFGSCEDDAAQFGQGLEHFRASCPRA